MLSASEGGQKPPAPAVFSCICSALGPHHHGVADGRLPCTSLGLDNWHARTANSRRRNTTRDSSRGAGAARSRSLMTRQCGGPQLGNPPHSWAKDIAVPTYVWVLDRHALRGVMHESVQCMEPAPRASPCCEVYVALSSLCNLVELPKAQRIRGVISKRSIRTLHIGICGGRT